MSQILQVHLEEKEYLLFNPRNDAGETPRYLFRVFTPHSQGTTDTHWVKSMAASDGLACGETDIFSLKNKQRAADMLNRHLRWQKLSHDNLVSWTSSLLVALVYIFHLRARIHKEATLDEIQLLVVDTVTFPKGVFMRDLDLMHPFLSVNQSLRNLEALRRRKSSEFSGSYYFGEYLSQGALKIEGHCQMVSAQKIIDEGLYDIRKEFKEFADWKKEPGSARWANAVLQIREVFYRDKSQREIMSERAIVAAAKISRQFAPSFQVPIAATLAALAAPLYHEVFSLTTRVGLSLSAGSCVCYSVLDLILANGGR